MEQPGKKQMFGGTEETLTWLSTTTNETNDKKICSRFIAWKTEENEEVESESMEKQKNVKKWLW